MDRSPRTLGKGSLKFKCPLLNTVEDNYENVLQYLKFITEEFSVGIEKIYSIYVRWG